MKHETANSIIAEVARDHLGIDTLESRNADSLDFHNLAVWKIKAALAAAIAKTCEACAYDPFQDD